MSKNKIEKRLLRDAIHALMMNGLPDEIINVEQYSFIKIPFIYGVGAVAYFIYDPQEKEILSIEYYLDGKHKYIYLS